MNKIIARLIISLAIGLIAGQVTGYLTSYEKYYVYIGKKTEVPKDLWESEKESSGYTSNGYTFEVENHFNNSNFYMVFAITSGVLSIILLKGVAFDKKNT